LNIKDTLAFSIAAQQLFNANIHAFMLPQHKICFAVVGTADRNTRHEAEASAPACVQLGISIVARYYHPADAKRLKAKPNIRQTLYYSGFMALLIAYYA
jgi:hypothetical protein